MQIEHDLGSLADGEPVAEVHLELGLIETLCSAISPCVKVLLPVTDSQCRVVEAKLRRCSHGSMIRIELVEVAITPKCNLGIVLIQSSKAQLHVLAMVVARCEVQPRVGHVKVDALFDRRAQQRISAFVLIAVIVLYV